MILTTNENGQVIVPGASRRSAPEMKFRKGENNQIHIEYVFNAVIIGEIGDGKSSLVQALTVAEERSEVLVARASRGVTKEIRKTQIRPELLQSTNAYILDCPGTGDADVSIRDMIDSMETFCETTNISCIILTCDASKGRCSLGARLANALVQRGFVNSYEHVVICGTKGDRLEDDEDREQWIEEIAQEINGENFDGEIKNICVSSLKMKKDKSSKEGPTKYNVDLDHPDTNIEHLISCLKKIKDLGTYAQYSMPDITELVNSIAQIMGETMTDKQKREADDIIAEQAAALQALTKQMQEATMSLQTSAQAGKLGTLLDAAFRGDLAFVESSKAQGVDLYLGDYDTRTALHLAVCGGQHSVVEFLLKHATLEQINIMDRWGRTPLDDALKNNHKAIIDILLEAGAVQGEEGETSPSPTMSSALTEMDSFGSNGQLTPRDQDWEMSVSRTFTIGAQTKSREIGELIFAASMGDVEYIKQAMDEGMNVFEGDYDKRTALHIAVCEGQIGVVELLLTKASSEDMNFRDRWGRTPLDDAIGTKKEKIKILLQEKGAKRGRSSRTRYRKASNRHALFAMKKKIKKERFWTKGEEKKVRQILAFKFFQYDKYKGNTKVVDNKYEGVWDIVLECVGRDPALGRGRNCIIS